MNLPQQLQEYLKYPALQIIDANTGLPADGKAFDALGQSVLITFLAGLYKATRIKENAVVLSSQTNATQLINTIFNNEGEVLHTIAGYTNEPINIVKVKLAEVSHSYITFLQENATADETKKEGYLQNMMTGQRSEILKYVPGGLKLGDLLNDPSLEDNTNKMQGPISTLMHKIENVFSAPD